MDREGFRNRMKQYKKAREENPGLKYWEWKDIPKYGEGTYGVRNYSTEENPIFYTEESAKDRYVRAIDALKEVGGWSNNLRDEIANEYSIPYIPEKEIQLTTGRYNTGKISTNLLDSIYDSAMRTGVPVDIALGLAGRESTLGIGRGFKKGQSVSGTNLMSNWQQIDPDIPSSKDRNMFNDIRAKILFHDDVSDDEYNFSADYIFDDINSRKRLKKMKENPIDNALKFYQSGKYNPGDKKHSSMVEEDAKILMSDPAIQKWAKEKGIAYAEGGEVEPDPLEVLERSRPKIAGIPINDKPLSGTDPLGELYLNLVSGNAIRKTIARGLNGIVRKSFYDNYKELLKAGWNRHNAYNYASPELGIDVLPGIAKGFDYTIKGANYVHAVNDFIKK